MTTRKGVRTPRREKSIKVTLAEKMLRAAHPQFDKGAEPGHEVEGHILETGKHGTLPRG